LFTVISGGNGLNETDHHNNVTFHEIMGWSHYEE